MQEICWHFRFARHENECFNKTEGFVSIKLSLNHPLNNQVILLEQFDVKVNSVSKPIESIEIDPNNDRVLLIKLDDFLYYEDVDVCGRLRLKKYNVLLIDGGAQTELAKDLGVGSFPTFIIYHSSQII